MHISHTEACRFILQNPSGGFADLTQPAPAVRVRAVVALLESPDLMTIGTCETLKAGPELMV